jgi:hypothetical protein
MSEAKIYDKGHSEYVEDVNRAGDIDQANEQARLDDAELVAGEATEKVSEKKHAMHIHLEAQDEATSARLVEHSPVT